MYKSFATSLNEAEVQLEAESGRFILTKENGEAVGADHGRINGYLIGQTNNGPALGLDGAMVSLTGSDSQDRPVKALWTEDGWADR